MQLVPKAKGTGMLFEEKGLKKNGPTLSCRQGQLKYALSESLITGEHFQKYNWARE